MTDTLAEQEQVVAALKENMAIIQAQLSSRDRWYPSDHPMAGQRMDSQAFWQWRGKAVTAMQHMVVELQREKKKLFEMRDAAWDRRPASSDEIRNTLIHIERKLNTILEWIDSQRTP